jgi:hypothetical protein
MLQKYEGDDRLADISQVRLTTHRNAKIKSKSIQGMTIKLRN